MKCFNYLSLLGLIIVFSWSCKKDNTSSQPPAYNVPTTYNFANVNYNNQIILLAMADQLVAKINLANTIPNTPVSTQTLVNIFNNSGALFNDSALNLNGSGLKLSDYFSATAKANMLDYLDSIGTYSQSVDAAAPGVPGTVASSASPNKKYLLSANGVFYSQVVKKEIMGMLANQIANVYMTDSINSSTNTTTLAHYWDQAFGFFGVPIDFPTNTKGLKYFGSYSNQVNAGLNSNASIMNAFLQGRAAISNNDLVTMKAQSAILIHTFDSLNAACIIQEMHETNSNIEAGDAVAAYGTLSESLGFVRNLKYNSGPRVITDAQIEQLLELYDSANPDNPNLYNFVGVDAGLTISQIETKTNAISQFIANIYGFGAAQSLLL